MTLPEPIVTDRKVRATLKWRHHFWGDYCATLILECESAADAEAGKAFLESLAYFSDIKVVADQADKADHAVVAFYKPDRDQEDDLGEQLEAFRVPSKCRRCDRKHSIGDTAHSIDWAEPALLEFEAPYQDHPGQGMLPL